jgi:3-isopropylmalate dehydrogenase
MMTRYRIASIEGDGIGPELMEEGLKVLEAVERTTPGIEFEFLECKAGASEYQNTGEALPLKTIESCRESHAIFKAPVGLPDVLKPDGVEAATDVILGLRSIFDLYVNLRPVELLNGVSSPLFDRKAGEINYVIVRENTEGLYVLQGGVLRDEIATNLRIITRKGAERIIRYAFELAEKRGVSPSDGVKRVTCVDSSKVLVSDLSPNLYGDIISDLAGATVGSIGLLPGGNIGDEHAMFEPIHGSAPTIAGKGIANPIAMIQAGKLLLEWLGDKHEDANLTKAALKIEQAVKKVLSRKKVMTFDLGGKDKTTDVGNEIVVELDKN